MLFYPYRKAIASFVVEQIMNTFIEQWSKNQRDFLCLERICFQEMIKWRFFFICERPEYHERRPWRTKCDHWLISPEQNGPHFADDIFKCNFWNDNLQILIKLSLKFVSKGPICNHPALVWMVAWRRIGDKLLSEPMFTQFTDAYMRH